MNQEAIIKGTFWAVIGLGFAKVVSLIIRMIVARLGVEQAGIFYLTIYIFTFASIIAMFGFQVFIVKDIAAAIAKKNKALIRKIITFSTSVLIPFSIIIALIVYVLAPIIATWFHEPGLTGPLRIAAVAIPFFVFINIALGFARGTMHWKWFLFFQSGGKETIRLLSIVVAFLIGGTLGAVLFGQLVAFAIVALIGVVFIFSNLEKSKKKVKFNWKHPLKFSLPIAGAAVAFVALEYIDSVMLGRMVSVRAVGVYDTAFSLAWVMLLMPHATRSFYLPRIMHVYALKKSLRGYYERVIAWNFAVNGLIAGVFILFGKHLLYYLFGPDFAEGYIFLIILSIGFWIGHSLFIARNLLFIKKDANWVFGLGILAVIVNVIANIILIPKYAGIGAAFGTATSLLVLVFGYVYAIHKDFKILPLSNKLIVTVFAMFALVFGWAYIKDMSIVHNLLLSLVLLAVYVIVHALSKDWRAETKYVCSKLLK